MRFNDLVDAVSLGIFKKTFNDDKYKDEIVTFLVAPMNAWDGKKKSMIGLIYVTSRRKRVFKQKHIDCMRFVADMIASSVSFTVQQFRDCGIMKTIRRVQ